MASQKQPKHDPLAALIARFAPAQQENVRKRIAFFLKLSWTDIDLTTPDGEIPDPMELIGTSPIKGRLLLPEPGENPLGE